MAVRDILRPMLASLTEAPLDDPQWVYEPKYDGIRAIAEVSRSAVHLWSRLGNEKTIQFPEIARALAGWARRLKAPVVLDGEIVALDSTGRPTGFQQLQGRIHVLDAGPDRSASSRSSRTSSTDERAGATRETGAAHASVAFIAFDLLKNGAVDLRGRPLAERRAALETLFGRTGTPLLRISDQVVGDGRRLYARALEEGWEGLIAKLAGSLYKSGKRTPDWRKLKILQEQEFVIGGWTEPRHSREYFGALLLGVYPENKSLRTNHSKSLVPNPKSLLYVGHTGTGFNEKELARVMKQLEPLETKTCPFAVKPKTNERPHWVEPKLVAEIKFTEWTADDKLRHPVYLGLRDDKQAQEVRRETNKRLNPKTASQLTVKSGTAAGHAGAGTKVEPSKALLEQLRAIEESRRDGTIDLPDGSTLAVSNLQKIFWPKHKLTKGDLMRYYVEVAACLLPAVESRPLVMKRLPNGVAGKAFYQQRAPDDVPDGVRVERVKGDAEVPSRIVGGSLKTLLYMTQLAAVSQDPWFSRVETPDEADHVALDLDPSDGVPFAQVLDVARWIHDELEWLGAVAFPKTSGADGLHIYVPLRPGTPYDAGLLFCQILATVVSHKHPREATVERAVRARGRRVYVDYLQNIRGKTLATAYSARASEYAGASTPVTWREVHDGFDREDFTIRTLPARIKQVGDLWGGLRTSKGADLSRVSRYTESRR